MLPNTLSTSGQILFALTLVAGLGCGVIAGVFFAFSAFVMKALSRLPPGNGIAAMQSINVAVINPWFLSAFLGCAVLCLNAVIWSLVRWPEPGSGYLFCGGVAYLAGTFLVTLVFNVPRNEALASVATGDADGVEVWTSYLSTWTAWNHVRTVAALAASASFGLALGSM